MALQLQGSAKRGYAAEQGTEPTRTKSGLELGTYATPTLQLRLALTGANLCITDTCTPRGSERPELRSDPLATPASSVVAEVRRIPEDDILAIDWFPVHELIDVLHG